MKLMNKLKRGLGGFVSFEKMEAKDVSDMPPLSEKQKKKLHKELDELYANPEVVDFIHKQVENYYHDDWISHKLPALGNKTPLEMVKNKEGREKVAALLDDLEASHNARPTDPYSCRRRWSEKTFKSDPGVSTNLQ